MKLNKIMAIGALCLGFSTQLMAAFPEVAAVIAAAKKEIPGITAKDLKK